MYPCLELPVESPSSNSATFLLCTWCGDIFIEIVSPDTTGCTSSSMSTAMAAAPWPRAYLILVKEGKKTGFINHLIQQSNHKGKINNTFRFIKKWEELFT